jgi:hypothetical protein
MQGGLRKAVVAAVVGAAFLFAIFAPIGDRGATAADPTVVSLKPETIKAHGFGHFKGDVRKIPPGKLNRIDPRPEPEAPNDPLPPAAAQDPALQTGTTTTSAPIGGASFQGLDRNGWGAGWPPDPNGDVGPNHYVQTVNTSIGIFDKSTGNRVAAFTFDGLFSSANTGTPCDNSNQGDPVALYDPIGDRYIVSDFAWADANFSTGPFFECIAVSKTNDPVTGGWYFYAWQVETGSQLPDYPKLGVWPDGIYMSANVFSSATNQFQNAQVWVFDRQAMEAGDPNVTGVTFALPRTIGGITIFSLLPSNARTVTGLPPAGSPNYFASIWGSYAIRVWQFHVDWATPANSTFSGPSNAAISTFNVGPSSVPELQGNNLDTLSYRVMMQNQYTNLGGRESLWLTHTVGNGGLPNVGQVRWYELPVTGGTISSPRQQSTWSPDSSNRFMPSLAVDKNGDMAIGYSVSDSSMYPAIRYSGRLASDPLSQLTQGESTLVQGLGYQCCTFSDGSTNTRWGDYSAMTIDPDGCTFWYTGEYYDAHPTTKLEDNWLTRIGSFQLPGCSTAPSTAPTISGFTPTSGPEGTSVTIAGTNFTGTTAVAFNGTAAAYTVDSDTQITATVPTGATSGPINVTTPNGSTTSSSSFTVTAPPSTAPTISGFTPTNGPVGTSVTISGTNLTGATSVTFNGTAATYTVDSSTQITATVPTGATSGPISVTTADGTATSASSFTVTVPVAPLTISGFSPASGPMGTRVAITGSGFTGATGVTFNAKNASYSVVSDTQIDATVPPGAKTGPITVTRGASSATSAQSFIVTKR